MRSEKVLCNNGDFKSAEKSFLDSIKFNQAFLGSDRHPNIAAALHALGCDLSQVVDPKDCVKYLDQCVSIYREFGYEYEKYLAEALNSIGVALRRVADYTRSEKALLECKKMKKDAPDIVLGICLNNLGIVMRLTNRKAEAEQYFSNAIKIYERIFNKEDHPDKANTLLHLGYLYALYGNPKADITLGASLAMYKNIFGDNSKKVEFIETKINTILEKLQAGESVKNTLNDDD